MANNENKNLKFGSLKIKREHKKLFDELAYQNRANQWQFLELLLENWCKEHNQDVYEQFKNNELP